MGVIQLPLAADAVLKASLILGLTGVVAAALRRASASARHLVWTLGLIGALAAPGLSLALPRWELPIVRVSAQAGAAPAVSIPADALPRAPRPGRLHAAESIAPEDAQDRAAATFASSLPAVSWTALAFLVWGAGAILILARMLLGLAAVQWMSRRTPAATEAAWLPLARSLARDLGITPRLTFLRSGRAAMPMACGILRPSVVMPADADGWPSERLRIVLLHELAHVKRRDCLTHLCAQLVCAAYWFNPLAWMAARRLRTERERACDDLVLAAGTRGSDYADQLLEFARVMRAGRFQAVLAGATLAMAHRSQLEGRLMAILDPSVPRRRLTRLRATVATGLFSLLLIPVASVQPWAEERPVRAQSPAGPETAAQSTPQPNPQPPQPPIESYPAQAAADVKARAATQDVVQATVQGVVESMVQGMTQGAARGIAGGIAEGVSGGIAVGIGRGVGTGVGNGIAGGIAGGIATTISEHAVDAIADAVADRMTDGVQDAGSAKARGRANDPRTIAALTEALKDTDKDVRETALSALARMRDPHAYDALVGALKDENAGVREQAVFGLGQLRDARAADVLTGMLKDSNASVREQAAFALGHLRARGAVAGLAAALKDGNAEVRQQAVFALGQIRDASAIDAISPALHDASPDVREQAAFALGQIRDHRAVDPLIAALKDERPNVREQAAFALGQIRDARAVDPLVIALKDSNADVREQSAFALGQIRDARAIDGLTTALKDSNASVRQQAAFALGQLAR